MSVRAARCERYDQLFWAPASIHAAMASAFCEQSACPVSGIALPEIPVAPGIKAHSIIPVEGEGDPEKGEDGVVAYTSAHVPYVESEFIVRGVHSCQGQPETIEEVRRILLEHLATLPVHHTTPSNQGQRQEDL